MTIAARWLVHALCMTVKAYQLVLSPVLPASCRFYPGCSDYALEALRRHGPLTGGWLAIRRILRCHPWGGDGIDPVPHRPGDHASGTGGL